VLWRILRVGGAVGVCNLFGFKCFVCLDVGMRGSKKVVPDESFQLQVHRLRVRLHALDLLALRDDQGGGLAIELGVTIATFSNASAFQQPSHDLIAIHHSSSSMLRARHFQPGILALCAVHLSSL